MSTEVLIHMRIPKRDHRAPGLAKGTTPILSRLPFCHISTIELEYGRVGVCARAGSTLKLKVGQAVFIVSQS
jgi:hypothetical protein